MGSFFLNGKIFTTFIVFIAGLAAFLETAFYGFITNRDYKMPTGFTKVLMIFAMIFNAFWGLHCFTTSHSISLRARTIGFKGFSALCLTSITLDLIWFGMVASKNGFVESCVGSDDPVPVTDAAPAAAETTARLAKRAVDCTGSAVLIGFSVAMFIIVIWRLYVLNCVFHFDIRWNQSSSSAPAPAPAPAASTGGKVNSLPKNTSRAANRSSSIPTISVHEPDGEDYVALYPADSRKLKADDFELSDHEEEDSEEELERKMEANRRRVRADYNV